MIERERAEQILKDADVLLEGHFLLTSGKHSARYMQCAKILQHPAYAEELASSLADDFKDDNIDIVVGPAMGGIIIAYELARQLKAKNVFAERENGDMAIRRGFTIEAGARVLVAEDVVTTGGSVQEVMDIVTKMGGNVVGVAVLVDRSNGKVDFGVKTACAYAADVVAYEKDECPLCKENAIKLVKPGSRAVVTA